MSQLMSNALAMQFNFVGHGEKHAFSKLILKDVVNGNYFSQLFNHGYWLYFVNCDRWHYNLYCIISSYNDVHSFT